MARSEARRPKLPAGVRLLVYGRDLYQCRRCGWEISKPDGYRGHGRLGVIVGQRRKLVYARYSMTGGPDDFRYADEPVWRYLEIDHIHPLVAGGAFKDPSNLQTLCSTCNNIKGARLA